MSNMRRFTERCQKSKFSFFFFQVYVPMESLINIFYRESLIEGKERQKGIREKKMQKYIHT